MWYGIKHCQWRHLPCNPFSVKRFYLSIIMLFVGAVVHAQCNGTASFTVSTPRCVGQAITFTNTSTGTPPTQSVWKFGNGNQQTVAGNGSSSHVYLAAGTYTVRLVRNFSGCSDSTSQTITVSANPTPGFTVTQSNPCAGNVVSFQNTSSGAVSYSWNFGDPSSSSNTSNQTNSSHVFQSIGSGSQIYVVTLTATNAAGCAASTTQNVAVNQIPDATLEDASGNNFAGCDGATLSLTVNNSSSTFATNTNYQINWGAGQPNFNSNTFSTQTVSYNTLGDFNLVYTVTGNNGCTNTKTYSVYNGSNPSVGFGSPGATVGLCGPATISFPLTSVNNNTPGTIYTVSTNDGTPDVVYTHPPPAFITHTFNSSSCSKTSLGGFPNAFHIRVVVSNPCGESAVTVEPIRVSTKPQVDFPQPPPICINSSHTFTASVTDGETVAINGSTCNSTLPTKVWSITPAVGWNSVSNLNNSMSINVNFTQEGTYTVRFIGGTSCGSDTAIKTICVVGPPEPNFTISPEISCAPLNANTVNLSATLADCAPGTFQWSVQQIQAGCNNLPTEWAFTNGTIASSISPQFAFYETGRYRVTLSTTNACGTFSHFDTVTVKGAPTAAITPLQPACLPASISPVVVVNNCDGTTPASYLWTFTGAATTASTLATPTGINYNSAGNYTVQLAVTNECGTTNASTGLTVSNLPSVEAGPNQTVCHGSTVNIGTPAIPGNTTHTWTPNTNLVTPNNPQTNVNGVNLTGSPINQVYTLTVSNGICNNSDQVTVTINPQPTAPMVVGDTVCAGFAAQLSATGTGIIEWYTAAVGGLPVHTGNVYNTPVLFATQTYYVNRIVNGCSTLTRTLVTALVHPNPVANAGPNLQLCNQPVPQQINGLPAGGTWTGSNVTASGVFTPVNVGNFNLVYHFVDMNGCTDTDTMQVTVIDPTQAVVGNDTAVCLNASPFIITSSPAGGVWSGSSQIQANGMFTPTTTGTVTLTYTVGSGSCQTFDTMHVTVNTLPVVQAGNDTVLCAGAAPFNITGNSPLGGSWSGTGITNAPLGTFNPTLAGTGTFVLTYTITGGQNCTNTDTKNITVNALPNVDAGPNQILCNQPIPTVLNGTPSGGTWTGTNVTSNGIFTPNGVGVFTLLYTFTNAVGCTSVDSLQITVNDPTPVNAGNDVVICVGQPSFNITGTPIGGTWSGTPFISAAGNFTPTTVGTYTIFYSFGSGTCATQDTAVITVHALPVVNGGVAQSVCVDALPFNITGQSPVGGTWSGSGITNAALGTFNPAQAIIGNNVLTYSFTNNNNCTNTATKNITVHALPVVNASNDQTLCNQAIPVQLNGIPAGGTWGGSNITVGGQFTPNGTGTFNVVYTYTNANSCTNRDTVAITVINPTPAVTGNDTAVCINQPAFLLQASPAGGTWAGSSFVSAGGLFSPTAAGTYTLNYAYGVGTCQTFDPMTITVHALPIVNAGNDMAVCIDAPAFNMNGFSPIGGTWSGTGITNGNTGNYNPAMAGQGAWNIAYTFTDNNSCTNSDVRVVTVNPLPVPNFTFDTLSCTNLAIPFTNTSAGANNYVWHFGDGSQSLLNNPSHIYANEGFFDVVLIASSVAGCSDSITKTIHVIHPPTAQFNTNLTGGCGPLTVDFNNLSVGTYATYAWNFGNGSSANIFGPGVVVFVPSVLADTVYTVTLTATNVCGSHVTDLDITVNSTPTAIFGTNLSQGCSPFNVLLTNISTGLPTSIFWDFGDGSTSNSFNPIMHTFSTGANDTTYTVMMVAENGCGSDTAYYDILVLPNTANAFFNTNPTQGCAPLTVNFTNFSSGVNVYEWFFGDGNISNQPTVSHTYTNAGTYTAVLAVNNGCSYDTAEVTITVFEAPNLSFTPSTNNVCGNLPITFNNTSTGVANSQWNFGDGNFSNIFSPSHVFGSTGTYTVSLSAVSTTNGCADTISTAIAILPTPELNITLPVGLTCAPYTTQFINNSVNANFYSWNFGDGNTGVGANPIHTYPNPGVYNVLVIGQNNSGCADTAIVPITLFPGPQASFVLPAASVCAAAAVVNIINTSSGAIGYNWNLGNGQTSTNNNPSVTYNNTGSYTITLIASNQLGCSDTASQTFNVYEKPIAQMGPRPDACVGNLILFDNNSIGATSYQWSFGDGFLSFSENPSHAYALPGTYDVTLIVSNASGCSDTVYVGNYVSVFPNPTAGFSINPTAITTGSPVITVTSQSIGNNSCTYYFTTGEVLTDCNAQLVFASIEPGGYEVIQVVANDFGCLDTANQKFIVLPTASIFVPNAFTPNGDGENDIFYARGTGIKTFLLLIYDRWGQIVSTSENMETGWNGKNVSGNMVKQDVYVWKIIARDINDELIKMNGRVTVIY